jgi:hypothetical protein
MTAPDPADTADPTAGRRRGLSVMAALQLIPPSAQPFIHTDATSMHIFIK